MQGYSAYEASQKGHQGSGDGDYGVQGSAALNSNDNNRPPQQGSQSHPTQPAPPHLTSLADSRRPTLPLAVQVNDDEVVQHAASQSGQSSDLFSQAMSFLNQGGSSGNLQQKQGDDLDEDEVQRAHQKAYGNDDSSQMGSVHQPAF